MNKTWNLWLISLTGLFTVLFFQNCSDEFNKSSYAEEGKESVALSEPKLAAAPSDVIVKNGQPFSLIISAGGGGLEYAWTKDGIMIEGAQENIYTVDSAAPSHGGTYRVVVSNTFGEMEVLVSVMVENADPIIANSPPSITTAPRDTFVYSGTNASFSVQAFGQNLNFQWYKQNRSGEFTPLEGKASASLALTPARMANTGTYRVVVSNAYGSAQADAHLEVAFFERELR